MLGIGMQEIIIILVVALIVIGPKKLPDLAKALGRAMGEFRRAADDLKDNLDINGVREEKEKLGQDDCAVRKRERFLRLLEIVKSTLGRPGEKPFRPVKRIEYADS